MKRALLIPLAFSSLAHSASLETTGCGSTYDSALKNAKTQAMEQVTGTWMNGEQSLKNGGYSERLTEYNGGVITSYKVISSSEKNSQVCVTILAEVDINKDNRVGSKTASVDVKMQQDLLVKQVKMNSINNAVAVLDDKNKAFIFKTSSIEYMVKGDNTVVYITGDIMLSPKWVDDIKTLGETINQAVSKNDSMVCVTADKQTSKESCYVINKEFDKFFNKTTTLKVKGRDGMDDVFSREIVIGNISIYDVMLPGFTRLVNWFSSFNIIKKYANTTMVLYKSEKTKVKFSFSAPTNQLASVDKFEFVFN